MGKAQGFFSRHQQPNVWAMTGLIIFAELSRLTNLGQAYSLLMVLVAIMGGVPLVLRAVSALTYRVISIEILVAVAIVGALIIGEYNEAAIVVWLFNLGDVLEALTLKKTRAAVKSLIDMAPQTATVLADVNDATGEVTDIDFVDAGDLVLVKAGDRVPVDGVVKRGHGLVNEASLTGEARPLPKVIDQTVSAGTILADGILVVEASRVGEDTTFGKIIELVEEAQDSKSKAQRVIDRFAKYYTPLIMLIALVVGLTTRDVALAITVLVLGCPGALVIGVPVSTVAGIGRAAKLGVLTKGSASLSALSKVDTLVFDKTGTVTKGLPAVVSDWWAAGVSERDHQLLVSVETVANHPLAKAILKHEAVAPLPVDQSEVLAGQGAGATVLVGNAKLLIAHQVDLTAVATTASAWQVAGRSLVYFAVDGQLRGLLGISDPLKDEAQATFTKLRALGYQNLIMLSGDNQTTAERVGKEVGMTQVVGNLMPAEKAEKIKELQTAGHRVAFLGDGVNDSPALATAEVGIAMGNGTDVALDVSDVVLLHSDLAKLPVALTIAKRMVANMNQNIAIAILTVALLFGGLFAGYVHMASGMLIHELSILIVIINGMRLLKIQQS
ncbi:heavy metal translocating P-type ATPase [Limosilactobacillus fermentum]